jgi:hypothetical protein
MSVTNVTLSNVVEPYIRHPVLEQVPEDYEGKTFVLQEELLFLLHRIHRKHPEWAFRVGGKASLWNAGWAVAVENPNLYTFTKVEVLSNGAVLGGIKTRRDYFLGVSNVLVYSISCKRLIKKRGPSKVSQTSNDKKAMKLVLDNFRADSLLELATNIISQGKQLGQCAVDGPNTSLNKVTRQLSGTAMQFVMANKDQFLAAFPESRGWISTMESAQDDLNVVNNINSSPKLYICIEQDDLYAFTGLNELKYHDTPDGNALPEWVRRKLGLLKLIKPTQYLRDVGVRISDKMYSIIDQGE